MSLKKSLSKINSNWGKTPKSQSLVYAFNSNPDERKNQDLGYDGLNDLEEKEYYFNGDPGDPSGDNYEYYLERQGSILNRYNTSQHRRG